MLQLGVLFRRQVQEDANATGGDRLIQHQAAYLVFNSAAPFRQLYHLI